jgi:hypothetical protein
MEDQVMQDSQTLAEQAARELAVSPKTSTTVVGPADEAAVSAAQVDAINQVFALFRLNYHNQYYAAFPDAGQLGQIKRLWLNALRGLSVEHILRGAQHAIANSEYLPTLHRMLESCRAALENVGVPGAREAYMEACRAPQPKSAQQWSHPAVFLAGQDAGWSLLATTPEYKAFPVFAKYYRARCDQLLQGEVLALPASRAGETDAKSEASASVGELRERLAALRQTTGV